MKETTRKTALVSFLLYVAAVFGITFLLLHFVGQRTVVLGASMEPALYDGDNLIVDKISYRFHEPERYDVIVFPYEDGTYYIKRIIGLPGEAVRIDENGSIYINGERISESYGKEVIEDPGCAGEEITLGETEYFVLGDNRNNSMDSRDERVGLIEREAIIGKAFVRIFPLNQIGVVSSKIQKSLR